MFATVPLKTNEKHYHRDKFASQISILSWMSIQQNACAVEYRDIKGIPTNLFSFQSYFHTLTDEK